MKPTVRYCPAIHPGHLRLEHPPEHAHPDVRFADVLGGAVGYPALADPGHDVLALDVIDDVVPLVVQPLVLVVDRIDPLGIVARTFRMKPSPSSRTLRIGHSSSSRTKATGYQ